jgi:stearoyl-CoA desaturase (delta-9 desaturase)
MSFRIPLKRVNWTTSAFLIGTALISVIFVPIYLYKNGIDLFQSIMFFLYLSATMMSITLGYHRLFSHLSFKAKTPVKLFTLIFGACAFENSALLWCSDHRRHHKHVDHDEDPYDITKGFFWAHIGWLLFKLNPEPPMDNVSDLRKDKLVMWQDRWTHYIGLIVGLILPPVLGYAWYSWVDTTSLTPWTGALGAFLISGVLRVVVSQHLTFFINSLCHTVGRQPYSTKHTARDSAVMAFLTFGEGYHNYHHEFQHDYRNGIKKISWDPTKWAIWTMSKVGLTSDLRRVSASKILLAEMTEAKRLADLRLAQQAPAKDCPIWQKSSEMLHALYDQMAARYAELEQVVANRAELSRQVIHEWRQETRELVRQLSRLNRLERA